MSDNSWELVNKAAVGSALTTPAAAASNAYNGYGSSGVMYHRSSSNNSNGSHLSPNSGTGTNSSNSGLVQQWHGVRLPTAPSSSSGTTTAEQWLAANNHLQQQHQNMSGINLSSTMITPSSNAAAAAAAAAQLYSGNTTSYFATGGQDQGIARPSLLPPRAQQAQVLSPTSPMISPTNSWPQSSRADSILAKQHHHQFHLPQNHQTEQRSPQQHHHNVAPVHGFSDKASHYHHAHQAQPQQYGAYTQPPPSAATTYEKLLEAVAIQAARVPFLNQPAQSGQQYHQEAASGNGNGNGEHKAKHSSLVELDILRNLAATAGNASGGHNAPAQVGQTLLPQQQQSNASFGTNGYGNSSFRPPATVKQEPTSFCDVIQPATPATTVAQSTATTNSSMPSSELDVAHTMLSIQTCSLQNTVSDYQQISPISAENSQSEIKYRPPTTNSTTSAERKTSGNGEEKVYAAITVETAQDSDDLTNPSAKRLKICTTPDINDDANGRLTGDGNDNDHSPDNAQNDQAKNDDDDDDDDDGHIIEMDSIEKSSPSKESPSPTMLSEHANNGTDDTSPIVSQSSPSNGTPLSVGGRSASIGSHSSRSSNSENGRSPEHIGSRLGATATATAVSFGGGNVVLPTVTSNSTTTPIGMMTGGGPMSVTHPPGLVPPSPFGAFTAQHGGNHANLHTCHICGFTSPSKFHFNSHMNTHADHKCDFCDYTSRTEGRLKRHMKEFHSPPQMSSNNSNDESSSHAIYGQSGGNAAFDQSLEEQLQAVVASMAAGSGGNSASFGNMSTTPPVKSGGGSKSKTYRCKQCEFVAKSKDDYWAHSRAHIKSDKLLTCPKCPFVTEYKHHLEYHLRNHFGSKPFKCVKCNYSCVNKSMLNSHMKSHSNFYQYRCSDCTYATKYCHSLKLHLRKYGHTPATTVTPDGGTLVDATAIDVYGNRRGPRGKKSSDNGRSSSGEGARSMVQTGGPMSASLPIASPTHLHHASGNGGLSGYASSNSLLPPMTLAESLSQHAPTMVSTGPNVSTSGQLMPFMEALQSSLLAQQQKDLTAAMVTSIATLGAQLPTIPSIAAALAAAQNQPNQLSRADSVSPSPGPINTGLMTPATMANSYQLTSPIPNIPPSTTPTMKCNLCDFSCNNKEMLTKHTVIHMIEKPEQLYQVYSFMAQAQALAAMQAKSQSTSGSSCGSTPVVNDLKQETTKYGSTPTPNNLYGSMFEESGGRYILSHDVTQDSSGSPASLSGGKASGDEGMASESFMNSATNASGLSGHRARRKGRAFKLDRIALKLQGKSCDDGDAEEPPTIETSNGETEFEGVIVNRQADIGLRHTRSTSPPTGCVNNQLPGHRANRSESVSSASAIGRPGLHHVESIESIANRSLSPRSEQYQSRHQETPTSSSMMANDDSSPIGNPIDWSNAHVCNHCKIAFKDDIMYTMHMGFHGYQDPYKCNTCGHVSTDPRSMFLHIVREPHL